MVSFTTKVAGATALLAGAASAQNFRVMATHYKGTPGETIEWRTWYGDGNMYSGPHIPESLENTLNYTIPDWSGTAPQVLIGPVAPATTDDLPEGTFVAINNGTGATDAVLFTNDESALGPDHISDWVRWGLYMIPQAQSGGSSPTESHFYLGETEEADTFIVTWRTPGTPDDGLMRVNLTAVL